MALGSLIGVAAFLVLFLSLETAMAGSPRQGVIFGDSFDSGKMSSLWEVGKLGNARVIYDAKHAHSGGCSFEIVLPPGPRGCT